MYERMVVAIGEAGGKYESETMRPWRARHPRYVWQQAPVVPSLVCVRTQASTS